MINPTQQNSPHIKIECGRSVAVLAQILMPAVINETLKPVVPFGAYWYTKGLAFVDKKMKQVKFEKLELLRKKWNFNTDNFLVHFRMHLRLIVRAYRINAVSHFRFAVESQLKIRETNLS